MNELIIIKLMLDKGNYAKYSPLLNKEYLKYNVPECYRLLNLLDYLHNNGIEIPSLVDFESLFWSEYPSLNKKDKQAFQSLFKRLPELEVADKTLDVCIQGHRERAAASAIGDAAHGVTEGRIAFSELLDVVANHQKMIVVPKTDADLFVTDDLNGLVSATYAQPGVRWKLKTLQKMMGSLRKGDMGFLFARPEVGKTTFLASQVSYFAEQVAGPIIHFNNEEYGPKVKLRYYQAVLGLTTKELTHDIEENQRRYLETTNGNIFIYDSASISRADVETICEQKKPSMLVFDSIDKIKGFQDDRDDLVYKQIYQWARELSKTYGPVIGVCHAAVSAEGKKWLDMDDVAYAKTAKQGEADWILGIGADYSTGQENMRYFHLSKNKLMGDEESDEKFRHARLPVMIHPEVAQYSDVMDFNE